MDLIDSGSAEVPGELLSRRGSEITMADTPMMPGSLEGSVYIFAGKRCDVGSFAYIGESVSYAPDDDIGIGLIRGLIGVVHAERKSASVLATTSSIASRGGEHRQHFEWQLEPQTAD